MYIEQTSSLFHLSDFCHMNPPYSSIFNYVFLQPDFKCSKEHIPVSNRRAVSYRERSIQFYHKDGKPSLMSLVTVEVRA